MADVRNYLREKEKREQNKDDYQYKIRKHKLTSIYRIVLVILALGALTALVFVQFKNHIYTSYEIVSSVEMSSIDSSICRRLGNGIVSYTNDGANYTNVQGEVQWNQTYEMQEILVSDCNDVIAIGEYNGNSIYIYNTEKKIGEINTTMPIRNLAVASTGRIAVSLADTSVTWIYIYDATGKQEFYVKSTMNQSGYPVSLSLSPNGELLAITYMYVESGVIKSNVSFHNFGEVGQNQTDYYVSGYTYTDTIIPYIKFMNSSTGYAVGDNRLMIFSGSQKPVLSAEYLLDSEVKSVFSNDKYIGLVVESNNSDNRYQLEIYNTDAQKVETYYFNIDYTDILFGQENVTIYNETECLIHTFDGVDKYEGNFDKSVKLMLLSGKGNNYKYVLLTKDSVDTIQLK